MKEAPSVQQATLTQTRSGSKTFSPGNIHERGDKVVVNGAKESLLSILRRHVCQCGKHSLEKLTLKFLASNRVAASYDILVWMFIFIRTNCHPTLYSTIVSEYLKKMNKKRTEDQTHRSQKYIDTKKKTLQKFIESAEILLADSINQTKIESSVGALYSKGKSRQNAFDKIKTYMRSKDFDLDFKESKAHCNFKLKSNYSNVETFSTEKIRTSDSQDSVGQSCSETYEQKPRNPRPLQEKPTEEVSGEMQEDQASKSYRHIPTIPSYDLFDELIQNDESAISLLSSYLNFQ